MSSLERLAAGCILAGFEGFHAPEWLRRWLERGLGGVVLFGHNVESPEQVAELTAELGDVVVAMDEEGGDVTRLEVRRGSSYPGNLALGAVDDVELTERVALAMAADLARAGVNVNLAPVADVNTNPANPVIGVRSFGSDPELVARHVVAFVRGTQRTGVAACVKHFPGHGDTDVDSHLALPAVDEITEAALLPFRAAVEAGVRAVMTAHIRVRTLGEEPATLDRRIQHDLLREELGFDGAVISDALEMRAIGGLEEGAVRALAAGVDALCLGGVPRPPDAVHAAIVEAVPRGRLSEERLREAAERTRALATRPTGGEADTEAGVVAARRAVVTEGSVTLRAAPLVVELVPEAMIAAGEAAFGLGDALRALAAETVVVSVHEGEPIPDVDGVRPLVLVTRDAHRFEWERETAETLLARTANAIVIDVGLPSWRPPNAAGYVRTHGAGRANLEAAAKLLLR